MTVKNFKLKFKNPIKEESEFYFQNFSYNFRIACHEELYKNRDNLNKNIAILNLKHPDSLFSFVSKEILYHNNTVTLVEIKDVY